MASCVQLVFVCVTSLLCSGCEANKSTAPSRESSSADAEIDRRIVVGGVYVTKDDEGGYSVSKVVAADAFAVHLRMYADRFDKLPSTVDTGKLRVLIGRAPLDPKGSLPTARSWSTRSP